MNAIWIGSPNYWAGRTQLIREILIHWSVGDLASTDATFKNSASQVSAQHAYERDERHDYVRLLDTSWAARHANPFTINKEISAGPGRSADEQAMANVIRDCAAEIVQFNLSRDVEQSINPHLKYVNTRCCGANVDGSIREVGGIDLKRIRQGVAALLAGGSIPTPVVAPNKPSLPQPTANKNTGGSLRLPASAPSWRIYREGGPYTVGNQIGTLNPSLFGGLTYAILANPTANVYVIQTRDFGRVAIYAGPETGASVAATNQGITMGAGGGKTVYLPPVPTWRAYPLNKAPTVGNEIGYLAPARFGGLAYAVLAQPQSNVVTVQTQSFGKVNLYVGSETGAQIK